MYKKQQEWHIFGCEGRHPSLYLTRPAATFAQRLLSLVLAWGASLDRISPYPAGVYLRRVQRRFALE